MKIATLCAALVLSGCAAPGARPPPPPTTAAGALGQAFGMALARMTKGPEGIAREMGLPRLCYSHYIAPPAEQAVYAREIESRGATCTEKMIEMEHNAEMERERIAAQAAAADRAADRAERRRPAPPIVPPSVTCETHKTGSTTYTTCR